MDDMEDVTLLPLETSYMLLKRNMLIIKSIKSLTSLKIIYDFPEINIKK
jgi:hypothetical protein